MAGAAMSSCLVNVTPHQVLINSQTDFSFQLTNTDSQAIRWIRIPQLSGYYDLNSASASGWTVSTDSENITFTGGLLSSGADLTIHINATASDTPRTVYWNVQVSDSAGGSQAIYCDGDTSVESGLSAPPQILNISLSNLTFNSVMVHWNTDKPASSKVYYGQSNQYGSADSGAGNTTNHQVTLQGLDSETGYHFVVESESSDGSVSYSEDNTFLTPTGPSSGSDNNPATNEDITQAPTNSSKQTVEIKAIPTEKVPPTISIATNLTKPFASAPKISGVADDNEAVARTEYSLDGGKNWLPTDAATGLGGKQVAWSFTPDSLEEGNYPLIMRAIDTSANIATTTLQTLVIDRLPPQVGGVVNTIGPQVLSPNQSGVLYSMAGVDQKITLSSVGGATAIKLTAQQTGETTSGSSFNLTRSSDTGLWAGLVSFQKPGVYNVVADAVDGAGKTTQRVIETVYALAPTRITDQKSSKPIAGAEATIYYLEPESNSWVVWEADAYGQANPQKASKDGRVKWLLPTGTYYLKVEARHYVTYTSRIFKLTEPTPLITPVKLQQARHIGFGRVGFDLPYWHVIKAEITPEISANTHSAADSLLGKTMPNFRLTNATGLPVDSKTYAGKPTVLSFISIWSPAAKEQLGSLASLQSNAKFNVVPVDIQENAAKVNVFMKISGYNLNPVVDPDGTTVGPYQVQNLPTHYFLDRQGTIKKVVTGVLSKQQLLDILGGL
jgi:peroxiredoxin